MPLLQMSGVWKRYHGVGFVLRGIDLSLSEGDLSIVTGPNGSGKTTLLRIGAGLLRPSRGTVLVNGVNPRNPRVKQSFGIVLHRPMLYEELTVEENLRYYAGLRGCEVGGFAARAMEALDVGRYLGRRVEELSYGWRRRVDLVRGLLCNPRLLLIDEPFSSLDKGAREAVARLIGEYVSQGGAVLAATPSPEEVTRVFRQAGLTPSVLLLRDGGLVERS